jgi:hypothetical protein
LPPLATCYDRTVSAQALAVELEPKTDGRWADRGSAEQRSAEADDTT